LPFVFSLIANIARKRPELNRDKTKIGKEYLNPSRKVST
jgi:hypothetical protein